MSIGSRWPAWAVLVGALLGAAAPAAAQTCNGALPAGLPHGLVAKTTTFDGVAREYCVYEPSGYVAGTPVPLVIALHGGSGNASVMYRPAKNIPTYAESEGFIAVFPNGLPHPSSSPPHRSFYWADESNLGYMTHLVGELQADYTIDPERIGFIGFSGGAKLIYRLIAADEPVAAQIRAVATVAGEIGKKPLDPNAPWEIADLADPDLPQMSALLVQGGLDPKLPPEGGLNVAKGDELVMSFRTKVDAWRVLTGTITASPTVPGGALPAGVSARMYRAPTSSLQVVEVLDQNLGHAWPTWDLTKVIVEFFKRS